MSKRKHVAPEFAAGRDPRRAARVAAVQGRRRSNAAGAHNSVPRQFRTRAAAQRTALNDQENQHG